MRRKLIQTARKALVINAAVAFSGIAHADTQTGLGLVTGASLETNPYNDVASNDPALALTAEIRPALRIREESTTLDIAGSAQLRQFTKRYGLEDNYTLNLRMFSRLSERVTLRSSGNFSYNLGGFNGLNRPGLLTDNSGGSTGTTPEIQVPINLPLTDVTVLGQRTRTKLGQANIGIDAVLSDRSRISASAGARVMRFKSNRFSDYDSVDGSLSYSQSLNERMSIGVSGTVSRTNYIASRVGDALVTSGQATFDYRFDPRFTLSLGAGLSKAKTKQLPGQSDRQYTTLSARGSLCREGDRSRFCISGDRSPQPTANGIVRTSLSVAADYSLKLSDRDRISVSGTYVRTDPARGLIFNDPAVDYVSGSARYDYQIRERMSFFANASYGKLLSSGSSRRANVGLMGGIRFDIGALK